jgi:hypothetical protein
MGKGNYFAEELVFLIKAGEIPIVLTFSQTVSPLTVYVQS